MSFQLNPVMSGPVASPNGPYQLPPANAAPGVPQISMQRSWKHVLTGAHGLPSNSGFLHLQVPSLPNAPITPDESDALCKLIGRADVSFATAMQSIRNVQLNSDLVLAIVEKKPHDNEIGTWTDKKTLLTQLPDALRTGECLRSFLSQAAFYRDWKIAQSTYQEACQRNLTDEKMHTIFIQFAKRERQFKAAAAAYNEADHRGQVTPVTQMVYVDSLVQQGQWEKAKKLFGECQFAQVIDDTSGIPMLDLHGYSHGAGLLESIDFLETTPVD